MVNSSLRDLVVQPGQKVATVLEADVVSPVQKGSRPLINPSHFLGEGVLPHLRSGRPKCGKSFKTRPVYSLCMSGLLGG